MPNLKDTISGFVAGDDLEVRRTITNIPTGQVLTKAWLTIKTKLGDADPGVLQKAVTTTDAPGTGQIVDDGATDQAGEVRFDLTGTDTALLVPPYPKSLYGFDIQVLTSGGKVYTPVKGTIWAEAQVTLASS